MVERWRAVEARGEHEEAFRRALEENERLSGAGFQRLSDRRWGRDDELGYDDAFAFDQALDNQGSPRAMAELLAMIAEQRCASGPSCRLMIEIMSRQEWREKIPAGLPPACSWPTRRAACPARATTPPSSSRPSGAPLVMVVYCKDLSQEQRGRAPQAIAAIAGELYQHLGDAA